MKKNCIIRILLLGMLFITLSACGVTEGDEVKKEKKDQVVETFLNEFFSFNKDDRYVSFAQVAEEQEDSEISRQAYEESYAALSKLSTQNCFEKLQQNRLPTQYDKYVVENELDVQIDELEYDAVEENGYEFSVTFKSDDETFDSQIKGKLTIKIIEDEVFVDEIIIY